MGSRGSTQGTVGVDGSYLLISRQRETRDYHTGTRPDQAFEASKTLPLNPSNPIKATPWLYTNTEPVKAGLTQTTTLWSSLPTNAHGQDSVRVKELITEQMPEWKRFESEV